MGDVKLNNRLKLPAQTDPDADEALRRDWAEANLAGGGGGGSTLSELLVASASTLTLAAGDQLIRYGRATIEGTLIIDGLVVIL